ncbi:MAG: ATPase, T2SS/T4P/T4SS family [Thermoplasmatota archaeon]
MEESDNAKKDLVSVKSSHDDAVDFINTRLPSLVEKKKDPSPCKSSVETLHPTITKIPDSLNGSMHFFSEKSVENPKSITRRKRLVDRQMNALRKQKKKEMRSKKKEQKKVARFQASPIAKDNRSSVHPSDMKGEGPLSLKKGDVPNHSERKPKSSVSFFKKKEVKRLRNMQKVRHSKDSRSSLFKRDKNVKAEGNVEQKTVPTIMKQKEPLQIIYDKLDTITLQKDQKRPFFKKEKTKGKKDQKPFVSSDKHESMKHLLPKGQESLVSSKQVKPSFFKKEKKIKAKEKGDQKPLPTPNRPAEPIGILQKKSETITPPIEPKVSFFKKDDKGKISEFPNPKPVVSSEKIEVSKPKEPKKSFFKREIKDTSKEQMDKRPIPIDAKPVEPSPILQKKTETMTPPKKTKGLFFKKEKKIETKGSAEQSPLPIIQRPIEQPMSIQKKPETLIHPKEPKKSFFKRENKDTSKEQMDKKPIPIAAKPVEPSSILQKRPETITPPKEPDVSFFNKDDKGKISEFPNPKPIVSSEKPKVSVQKVSDDTSVISVNKILSKEKNASQKQKGKEKKQKKKSKGTEKIMAVETLEDLKGFVDQYKHDILEKEGLSEDVWQQQDFYALIEPFAYVTIMQNVETRERRYVLLESQLNEEEKGHHHFIVDAMKTFSVNIDEVDDKGIEPIFDENIEEIISDYGLSISPQSKMKISYWLKKELLGFDKLEPLMRDKEIEDISCDGSSVHIFLYHRRHGSIQSNVSFEDEEELSSFVMRLAQKCGKHISIANPMLDATMPDGSRIQMTLSTEVSTKGSTFTIRKFKEQPFSPTDIVGFNTMSSEMMAYLWLAVQYGANALIAGGTASGKTSTLNAMALFIPRESKIVSIEETREINLPHPNWIPGVTRTGFGDHVDGKLTGEIDLYDLMKAALRQRPEYIIVGEIRGKEAYVLFQAMATGHTTYSTVHADSTKSLIHRLEGEPINIPRIMLQSLDIICIQTIARVKDKRARRCKQIIEVIDIDPTTKEILTNEVFRWDPVTDTYQYTGKSYFLDQIRLKTNQTHEAIIAELQQRSLLLRWMVSRNIHSFDEVATLTANYYENPEGIMSQAKE